MKCFGYNMNCKKAILLGILLWVIIFFEISILMFGFGLEEGMTLNIVHYILIIPILGIISWYYFKDKKASKGFGPGLLLGVIFVAIGIFLDLVITIPLFIKDYTGFFSDIYLWLGFLEGVVITALVGSVMKK